MDLGGEKPTVQGLIYECTTTNPDAACAVPGAGLVNQKQHVSIIAMMWKDSMLIWVYLASFNFQRIPPHHTFLRDNATMMYLAFGRFKMMSNIAVDPS